MSPFRDGVVRADDIFPSGASLYLPLKGRNTIPSSLHQTLANSLQRSIPAVEINVIGPAEKVTELTPKPRMGFNNNSRGCKPSVQR